jgi:hypothetical protein
LRDSKPSDREECFYRGPIVAHDFEDALASRARRSSDPSRPDELELLEHTKRTTNTVDVHPGDRGDRRRTGWVGPTIGRQDDRFVDAALALAQERADPDEVVGVDTGIAGAFH